MGFMGFILGGRGGIFFHNCGGGFCGFFSAMVWWVIFGLVVTAMGYFLVIWCFVLN